MPEFDNFVLMGDFNSEVHEQRMNVFCETYNLKNLITSPTCFKNPLNPSSIDVILTNKSRSFQNSQVIETGISDHHKLTITVLRTYFQKQSPVGITYRNYKKIDMNLFHFELNRKLNDSSLNCTNYDEFESIFMELLNSWAPIRKKYVRANNAPYMNKTLSKAIMTRSRVRNKFLKNPNNKNRGIYNKQRNYCVNLLRKRKKAYKFLFSKCSPDDIMKIINNLNIHKPTTFNNIPVKLIVATSDIFSPLIAKYYNDDIINCKFPLSENGEYYSCV